MENSVKPEPGDLVRATRIGIGGQVVVGTLMQAPSDLDIHIRRLGEEKVVALVAREWQLTLAHPDERRYRPMRMTPVMPEDLAHHLWERHGMPLEQVKAAPVGELLELHDHLHRQARDAALTLNHIHGMTPSEERILRQGLEP